MFIFNVLSMIFSANESDSFCKVAWPGPRMTGDATNLYQSSIKVVLIVVACSSLVGRSHNTNLL
jgi:hypothetical protein